MQWNLGIFLYHGKSTREPMRRYIRHPTDIPIKLEFKGFSERQQGNLNNVSWGGLSFQSKTKIVVGVSVVVQIPIISDVYKSIGCVVWCRKSGEHYDVGIQITEKNQVYRTRMIEQLCHIEHYKREVLKNEGRSLSSEEAAQEWIDKHAQNFPEIDVM